MPLFEKTEEQRNYSENAPEPGNVPSQQASNALDDLIGISTSAPVASSAPPAASNLSSLVDLLGDNVAPSAPSVPLTNGGVGNDLLGSLGVQPPPVAPSANATIPPITAWQNEQVKVDFNFNRPEGAILAIQLVAQNISLAQSVSEFVAQAAVPKQLQIQLAAASWTQLSPGATLTQQMRINNPTRVPLKMKLRISYKLDGQLVQVDQVVNNFPPQSWQ